MPALLIAEFTKEFLHTYYGLGSVLGRSWQSQMEKTSLLPSRVQNFIRDFYPLPSTKKKLISKVHFVVFSDSIPQCHLGCSRHRPAALAKLNDIRHHD